MTLTFFGFGAKRRSEASFAVSRNIQPKSRRSALDIYPTTLLATGAILFLCAALPGHPVETLFVQRKPGREVSLAMPLGHAMTSTYLHSVEQTQVEDVYYAMGARLWQWRTRTRSHSAELPWHVPETGRVITENGWLILEGGRRSWDELFLRVGDSQLGRNELVIGKGTPQELYKKFPGERLRFSVKRRPLVPPVFL